MAATFHLTDGTTIDDVTTYNDIHQPETVRDPDLRALLCSEPHYTVFHGEGLHQYVPVARVARIESMRNRGKIVGWFSLPMAEAMWAADGRDLNA